MNNKFLTPLGQWFSNLLKPLNWGPGVTVPRPTASYGPLGANFGVTPQTPTLTYNPKTPTFNNLGLGSTPLGNVGSGAVRAVQPSYTLPGKGAPTAPNLAPGQLNTPATAVTGNAPMGSNYFQPGSDQAGHGIGAGAGRGTVPSTFGGSQVLNGFGTNAYGYAAPHILNSDGSNPADPTQPGASPDVLRAAGYVQRGDGTWVLTNTLIAAIQAGDPVAAQDLANAGWTQDANGNWQHSSTGGAYRVINYGRGKYGRVLGQSFATQQAFDAWLHRQRTHHGKGGGGNSGKQSTETVTPNYGTG